MSPQTEDTRRINGQTLPSNDAGEEKRPRKPWLVLGIALIAVAAVFVWGIWSRVRARTALSAETAQVARPAGSGVLPKRTLSRAETILPRKLQPSIHYARLYPHHVCLR